MEFDLKLNLKKIYLLNNKNNEHFSMNQEGLPTKVKYFDEAAEIIRFRPQETLNARKRTKKTRTIVYELSSFEGK